MSSLSPDWHPEGDPARVAESREETAVAEVAQEVRQERRAVRTRALDGITVILDAGHGGRDPGALGSGGLTENEVVYDIMCRVMRELSRRTRATVHATIEDTQSGYEPSSAAVVRDNRRERLLTTPPYDNSNIVTSANLRWYIANARVRSIADSDGDLNKVVFTSFHADALHASVRGAMIYVPSARHCGGRYVARPAYRRYREVQVRPTVSHSYSDRIRSQAMSEQFAQALLEELRRQRVEVHDRKAIRGYVIRGRRNRPWVPAVLRYNATPTKLLVEVGNIKNRRDAADMRSPQWRQRFAEAYVSALVEHFGG
jgi:N-acetylmuramoyl-L-alanine amidase